MNQDSTLERIWEARRRIYAKCDNDPVKLVEYYRERQKKNADRLIYAEEIEHVEEDKNFLSPHVTAVV